MRIPTVLLAAIAASFLSGCMQDPASRGLAGAAAGAIVADALDENIIAGAALGGVAGVASCSIPGVAGCPTY
jgi:hypothetical protein